MPLVQNIRRFVRFGVAAALAVLAAAAFGATAASAASSLPPEGIFEDCSLDTQMSTCLQRLEVMHQGGMQVVVIPGYGASLSSLQTYASAAHSLGMSVMWELSNPGWWQDPSTGTQMAGAFSNYASACGCSQNYQVLAYVIRWLGSQPGTYGYYAADDSMLSAGDQGGVASYVGEIKQVDPSHTVMIGSADQSQTNTYQRISDVIGTEMYPVTTSSLMPVASNQDIWGGVAQQAVDAQNTANAAGKQSAFILQAFTWGDNVDDGQAIGACSPSDSQLSCYDKLRYPSSSEQLQLRNEALLHAHPKIILWWSFPGTYGQAGNDTYSIYPTGAVAAARWAGLSAAVQAPAPGSTSKVAAAHAASAAKHTVKHSKHHRKHRKHHKHHRKHLRRKHA